MPRFLRYSCAFADEPAKPYKYKPAKKRSEMTEEEKLEADEKTLLRKGAKAAKEEWEKSLPAEWKGPHDFKWPKGTIGIYKSDAKSSFGLTEKDVLTLPHEPISGSPKTFFSLADVRTLAFDKFFAAPSADYKGDTLPGQPKSGYVRIFKKLDYSPSVRTRKNWHDLESVAWVVIEWIYAKDDPRLTKALDNASPAESA